MDVEAQPGSRMSFGSSRELKRRIPFENSAQLGTWRDLMKNGYVGFHEWTWSVVASPQQSSTRYLCTVVMAIKKTTVVINFNNVLFNLIEAKHHRLNMYLTKDTLTAVFIVSWTLMCKVCLT